VRRIIPLSAIIILAIILIADIGLISKYQQKPSAFELTEKVSFIHYAIFHVSGIYFAYVKAAISTLLLALWAWQFLFPSKLHIIKHLTATYSLVWSVIGVFVITGVVGVLQYSAGLHIKLYDFTPLIVGLGLRNAILLSLAVIWFPLALMFIPRLHNRFN
jgi:hypothetical protein